MWGYRNILLWYYNFNLSVSSLNYREHFIEIMKYLLSDNNTGAFHEYKRYAFASLIYLLSFRSHDPEFCQEDSSEFLLAKQVIIHFEGEHNIKLKDTNRDKSLNQYFQEMIEGSLVQDDIDNLLQG
jgi:hypothetical protein